MSLLSARRTASRLLWSWGVGRLQSLASSGPIATLQAQFNGDRLIDKAKLVQHFGFASAPPKDTDVVAICPSGEPTSALVIASNSQAHRPPELQDGDSVLYDSRGAYLLFAEAGPILEAGGQAVTIRGATSITVEGATTVTVNGAETLKVTASKSIDFDTPLLKVTGDVVAADVG